MRFTDLSIDLETLGTDPGSVITQIGLCAFNARGLTTPPVSSLIYIDPQSCIDAGMTVSWSTISWWMVQSAEARDNMVWMHGVSLDVALTQVDNFINMHMHEGFKVWGNGACFDVVLLEDAYRRLKRQPVWRFRDIRDIRTIGDLRQTSGRIKPKPEVEHNAEHDARAQAQWVSICMMEIEK